MQIENMIVIFPSEGMIHAANLLRAFGCIEHVNLIHPRKEENNIGVFLSYEEIYFRIGIFPAQLADKRRRENNISERTKAYEENFQCIVGLTY